MSPAHKGDAHKGGAPASALQLKVCELLRDGEWMAFDEVVRKAGVLVPPGRAIRRAERQRVVNYAARAGVPYDQVPPRKRPLSTEGQIAAGRRAYVAETLTNRHGAGYFEKKKADRLMVRMVRVPSRVKEAWEAIERGEYFDPEELADRLQDDPHTSISDLTQAELRRLVGVLVDRLGEADEAS